MSVIGGDSDTCAEEDLEMARAVGRGIAKLGAILVCGGRGGVMEASCRGAKEEGGATIGILPSSDRKEANPYVDHAIVTGMGVMRNALVVMNGDIVVAIDGGYGTLSEISFAHKYKKKVLGIGTWELDIVEAHDTPEELLDALKRYLSR